MNILYIIIGAILSVPAFFIALLFLLKINEFIEEHEGLFRSIIQILFNMAFVAIFIKVMSL